MKNWGAFPATHTSRGTRFSSRPILHRYLLGTDSHLYDKAHPSPDHYTRHTHLAVSRRSEARYRYPPVIMPLPIHLDHISYKSQTRILIPKGRPLSSFILRPSSIPYVNLEAILPSPLSPYQGRQEYRPSSQSNSRSSWVSFLPGHCILLSSLSIPPYRR